MTYKTTSTEPGATLRLGANLGRRLRGGELIELSSDLGGGKTVIVKGLAQGLGYRGEVTSPTFTVSRIYRLPGGLELHHFDFYRLEAGDVVAAELSEVLGDPTVIVAVEWAGQAGDVLPAKRLLIEIKAVTATTREITVTATDPSLDYVIKGLSG
ncbi:tRNA (adenosine(37)-N6)-threonylcarbamoyltransferase complex ATPase subunit type 1 TsaE [Candidatus Parcubacteria bacterium]|nr:tRNA (adenosine(37)-N6)-threonylcarbamoyltransferase complex ATPase subunit type 1 TsaE [Candidatus Parcubacteria bacterium]